MPKTQTKRGLSPRELDALRKQYVAEQKQADSASKWQLANDIAAGINDIVGRGVVAPLLGIPGDINQALWDAGAWVNNKIKDVEVATGMVKQPKYVPYSQGNAYLGSEDIGNRMERAGLVSSERRPMTELAASFISPGAAAKTAINAPKTAMNMLRMAENIEAPSRGVRNAQGMYIPRGQMGAIDLGVAEAPQAKALREAQINAAKPVSEGGLGLRPDNMPEERAMAMGFVREYPSSSKQKPEDMPLGVFYHGTNKPITEFSTSRIGNANDQFLGDYTTERYGTFMAENPDFSATFATNDGKVGANIMPLMYRSEKPAYLNSSDFYDEIKPQLIGAGYSESGINYTSQNPETIWESFDGNDKLFNTLRNNGYDSADMVEPWADGVGGLADVRMVLDPRNIRSRFAAFDPMRRNSSDLLAGIALPVVAAPVVSESDKKKRKDKNK